MVQVDAGRRYAPRGLPANHRGAATPVSLIHDRVDRGAAGTFPFAAQAVPALMGSVCRNRLSAGPRLPECRRTFPGTWFGSRTRDQHAAGTGRLAGAHRPPTA